jgi:2-C-methyl-D-erythritol 2,4-cyclodiphosphate synthase
MRAGIGFDVHRFDASRPLVLGGVRIEGSAGLAGHSDADVVCHAVADALLGAAALGDLGSFFPDSDEMWKDASSLDILSRVAMLVREAGYRIENVDATVLLEAPRLAEHRSEMCVRIAQSLALTERQVSVKATTAEGLGTVGRGEGAACMAVALVDEVGT